jgi:hypothetical protein
MCDTKKLAALSAASSSGYQIRVTRTGNDRVEHLSAGHPLAGLALTTVGRF